MIVAEISENCSGVWTGQLRDADTGINVGPPWLAASRGELIATIKKWTPLSHLIFKDRMDPLDP